MSVGTIASHFVRIDSLTRVVALMGVLRTDPVEQPTAYHRDGWLAKPSAGLLVRMIINDSRRLKEHTANPVD